MINLNYAKLIMAKLSQAKLNYVKLIMDKINY